MNYAYSKFCEMNPDFEGDCSILGHSLGSVISFDILNAQLGDRIIETKPSAPPIDILEQSGHANPSDSLFDSQSYMSIEKKDEILVSQQLIFQPTAFYAVGSPIGNLLCVITNNVILIIYIYRNVFYCEIKREIIST